jgi:hypothetical protein
VCSLGLVLRHLNTEVISVAEIGHAGVQTARKPDPSREAEPNEGSGPREGSEQQLTLESTDEHSGFRRRNGLLKNS